MKAHGEHYLSESNFEIRGAAESKQFLCKKKKNLICAEVQSFDLWTLVFYIWDEIDLTPISNT